MDRDQLLWAVAQSLAYPVFVIDADGRYLDVVGGAERCLYASNRSLIGRKLHDVLPKERADQFLTLIHQAINLNQVQTVEFELASGECLGDRLHRRQEKHQWYEGRISPVQVEGIQLPCVTWAVMNITERKQLEQKLRLQSQTDELTGIHNRRFFMESLKREIAGARRRGSRFSLAIVDIDFFKSVNDEYGHHCGDMALKQFTDIIGSVVRESDLLGRIGGEEFALILKHSDLPQALGMVERLLERLRQTPIRLDKDIPVCLTASIGLTEWREQDQGIDELLIRADTALYRAKEKGRNRIEVERAGPETDNSR